MKEIENMRQLFYNAHSNISFDPEKRADSCVKDFTEELTADLAELGENTGNYKEKYLEHVRIWASRKSRCLSPMITGPARFPVARNEKANNSERKAWEEFRTWRKRYFSRATAEKTLSPESDIEVTEKRLAAEEKAHSVMIEVNKILRKKIEVSEKRQLMAEKLELKQETIDNIFKPDFMGRIGFETYQLSYSNARIKKLKDKLLTLKNRIAVKETFSAISFNGGSISIDNDRVVIAHDAKPERTVIDSLKSRGFRWSPSTKTWVRKHTAIALRDAKELCNIQ